MMLLIQKRFSTVIILLLSFILLLSCIHIQNNVYAANTALDIETTREEILASRRRRAKHVEAMLEDSRQRLIDHNNNIRLLSDKEKIDVEKKINIYQRKLDSLQSDLDEREIERLLKKEKLRNERLQQRRNNKQRSEL